MKAIIIGGGIIGMLTACSLAKEGIEVILIEKSYTGQESSWAGGGIISPLYPWRYNNSISILAQRSQLIYADLCNELQELSGIDPEYHNSGLLIFAPNEINDAIQWAKLWDVKFKLIDKFQCQEINPNLNIPSNTAIWLPEVCQVRNPRIIKAARGAIKKLNVSLLEQTEVIGYVTERDKVIGVKTADNLFIRGDNIFICAGAWSAHLLEDLEPKPNIIPVKGQMLLFASNPCKLNSIILWKEHYIIPRKDGRIIFGSTLEYSGFIKQTTHIIKEELHKRAIRLCPMLYQCFIERHWAGLRPGSPAGIPYIGHHPTYKNLFINAGHFRNGIVLGPASVEIVTSMLFGEKPKLDPSPYKFSAKRVKNL